MAELHQFITVFAAILSVVRQRFFGEALRETHGTNLDQRKIVIENAMAPFHLISTHHPPSSCYGWDFWRGPLKQEYLSEGFTEEFMHTLWGVLKYTYIHNRVEYLLTI